MMVRAMGRQENTGELFLTAALKLFSERGYDTVTLAEIAREVGCVPSALYRHYKSKQDLYNAILEKSRRECSETMDRSGMDLQDPTRRAQLCAMGAEELAGLYCDAFLQELRDEWSTAFRKLMMLEQFEKKELADLYNERYIFGKYDRYAELFSLLTAAGRMAPEDPYTLAVTYASPMIVMIGLCDRDPASEQRAIETLRAHALSFWQQRLRD